MGSVICEKDKENIYIWGTGRIAEAAFLYYRDNANIVGFIENDNSKWNSTFHNIRIYSPSILQENKIPVVLAHRVGADRSKELLERYGIKKYRLFDLTIQNVQLGSPKSLELNEHDVVIRFSGGLGNQMFQYALYRYYKDRGGVYADLSYYDQPGVMPFVLTSVFSNAKVESCFDEDVEKMMYKIIHGEKTGNIRLYTEKRLFERNRIMWDQEILNIKTGYLRGGFQYYQIAESIKEKLYREFVFTKEKNTTLRKIENEIIQKQNTVSIHLRRGDYLDERNKEKFGGVCTENYYISAREYLNKMFGACHFFV
ncbi:MAG: alpha-1,2-fucosyltransferase, partial [Lachnospiraceae bacterium]|nr:alpha-1,2-fucosyltransferase [Lachnospiraceae bacterium]